MMGSTECSSSIGSVPGPVPVPGDWLVGDRAVVATLRQEWDVQRHADVTIVCGPPGSALTIRTHRIVLATLSSLLGRAMLSDQLCCPCDEDSVVLLPDLTEEESVMLKTFLQNVYFGSFEEVQVPQAIDFLGLAEQMLTFQSPADALDQEKQVPDSTDQTAAAAASEQDCSNVDLSNYCVETERGIQFLDDPDLDPETVAAAKALLQRKVKLQVTSSVHDREAQILAEREAHPVTEQARNDMRRAKPGTSKVWHFFRRTRDKKFSVCKECNKKFRHGNGTTTTLVRHLKGAHPELHEEFVQLNSSASLKNAKVEVEVVDVKDVQDTPKTFAKRSPIWNHFESLSKEEARCKACQEAVKLVNGSTVYLSRHLLARHPEILKEVKAEFAEKKRAQNQEEEELSQKAVITVTSTDGKLSPIWKHFQQESLHKVRCLVCKELVRCLEGSTSSALKHLRRRHPELELSKSSQNDELLGQFFDRGNAAEDALCLDCDANMGAESAESLLKHLQDNHEESYEKYLALADRVSSNLDKKQQQRVKVVTAQSNLKKKAAIWSYFDHTADKAVHICKACRTQLSCKKKNASNLARHLRVTHERLYRQYLIDCGYAKDQIEDIVTKQHLKRGPKPISSENLAERTCPECKKEYSSRKGMLVHQLAVHSGERPFVCQECGMSFARKESFKRHNHTGEKPFLCSVCGKTFARRHIRDIHEKAHYGEKRYGCSYCEKRFTTNQKKTIHERIHTGEKPYECNECGKKFVQMHQLQTHMRIHTGARPYQCEHCHQMFRHLSTRAKHNCPGQPIVSNTSTAAAVTIQEFQGIAVADDDQSSQTTTTVIEQVEGVQQHIEVYDESNGELSKQESIVL